MPKAVLDKLTSQFLLHDHVNTKGDTMTGSLTITPTTDAVDILRVNDKDSNVILSIDTILNRMGLGTSAPEGIFHAVSDISEFIMETNDDTDQSQFICRRAKGTTAVRTAVVNTNSLGNFSFRGYNGTVFTGSKASIAAIATEDWTTTANGTKLVLRTTPNLSTTLTDRLVIDQSGLVSITSITEQFRPSYDASNYWKFTVGATGGLALAGVGTGGALTITPTAGQSVNINLSTTGVFAVATNSLYVDTADQVGIGTVTPQAPLHVYSGTPTTRYECARASGGAAWDVFDLWMTDTSSAATTNVGKLGFYGTFNADPTAPTGIYWYMGATATTAYNAAALKIDSSNNVGAGLPSTNQPQTKFHVQHNSGSTNIVTDVLRVEFSSTGTAADGIGVGQVFFVEDASGNADEAGNIDVFYTTAAHATQAGAMTLGVMGGEKIRITNGGKVGIMDTNPGSVLDVTGDINTTENIKVDDVQVVSNRVIDARIDDTPNSGDATTDGIIAAIQSILQTHGLAAAA